MWRRLVWAGFLAHVAVGSKQTLPAFVWSGSEALLPGKATYDLDVVASNVVESLIVSSSPTVAVLVVVEEGSAADMAATSQLGPVVQAAPGSRIFPFVAPPTSSATDGNYNSVAWSEVRQRLAGSRAGEVLLTVAPDLAAVDRDVADLTAKAAARAADLGQPGSYVLGVTVATGPHHHRRLNEADNADNDKKGVRMTPDILAGILIGLLFTLTTWLGMYCIGAIQTPSHFASKGPPSLKEW